jgi:hypothetical protein
MGTMAERRLEAERTLEARMEAFREECRGLAETAILPGKNGSFSVLAMGTNRDGLRLRRTFRFPRVPSLPSLLMRGYDWRPGLSSASRDAWKDSRQEIYRISLAGALAYAGVIGPVEALEMLPVEVVLDAKRSWHGLPGVLGDRMTLEDRPRIQEGFRKRLETFSPEAVLPGTDGDTLAVRMLKIASGTAARAANTEWYFELVMDWIFRHPVEVGRAFGRARAGKAAGQGGFFWSAVERFLTRYREGGWRPSASRQAALGGFVREVLARPDLEEINKGLERAMTDPDRDLTHGLKADLEAILGGEFLEVRARIRAARALQSGETDGPEPFL